MIYSGYLWLVNMIFFLSLMHIGCILCASNALAGHSVFAVVSNASSESANSSTNVQPPNRAPVSASVFCSSLVSSSWHCPTGTATTKSPWSATTISSDASWSATTISSGAAFASTNNVVPKISSLESLSSYNSTTSHGALNHDFTTNNGINNWFTATVPTPLLSYASLTLPSLFTVGWSAISTSSRAPS